MSSSPIASDELSQQVIAKICALADGNCAKSDDVMVKNISRTDYATAAQATIQIGWRSDASTTTGQHHPNGSRHCASFADLDALLKQDCNAVAGSAATAEKLANTLRPDAANRFRTLNSSFKVEDLPFAYHHWETCNKCRGNGQHACEHYRCLFGLVPCSVCHGDGKRPCANCSGGIIYYTVQVRDHAGNFYSRSESKMCGQCSGTGRIWGCYTCNSSGKVNCPECHGTSKVACKPCDATGWFTHRYWTWLTGAVSRCWLFAKDAPERFKRTLEAMPIMEFPGLQATVTQAAVSSASGVCTIRLDCSVPHVAASMTCLDASMSIDAVGTKTAIPLMPHFLDTLLKKIEHLCLEKSPSPHAVIKKFHDARVTVDVLHSVGKKGKKFKPEDISALYSGAVSTSCLTTLHRAADKAYDGVARSEVNRTWLFAAPIALGVAGLSALYDKDGWLTPYYAPYEDWGLAIMLLPLIWLSAGALGQKAVQALMGNKAARRPRQGVWPVLAFLMAALLHGLLLLSPYDAYGLGLPFSPQPSVTGGAQAPMGYLLPVTSIPSASMAGQNISTEQSSAPLLPQPVPPDAQLPGFPSQWKIQSALKQLNFYHGPVDGGKATPEMKASLEAYLESVPDYLTRYVKLPFDDIVAMGLNNQVRLILPANRTLAAPMTNLARANLNVGDLSRLEAAAERAHTHPGQEQTWQSADGHRSGSVIMSQSHGSACGTFALRVEIGGAMESAGPLEGCRQHGQWSVR